MYEKLKELLSDESRRFKIMLHTSDLSNEEFTLDLNYVKKPKKKIIQIKFFR